MSVRPTELGGEPILRVESLSIGSNIAGRERTIVAGIALHHKPETLVGKSALFVANLAPRELGKGLVSEGMILAAGDESILTTVAGDVPPGTRVR